MKTFAVLFLSSLLIYKSFADEAFHQKLNLENAINYQLKNELSAILPPDTFSIFSSVTLRKRRVREVIEGENFVNRRTPVENDLPVLPGFQKPITDEPEQQEKKREVYQVSERYEMSKVNVRLLLSKNLPPEVANTARQVMTSRVQESFGSKGKIQVLEGDFPSLKGSPGMGAAGGKLGDFLSQLKDGILPILGIFLLLFGLFWLLRKLFRSRSPDEEHSTSPLEPPPTHGDFKIQGAHFQARQLESDQAKSRDVQKLPAPAEIPFESWLERMFTKVTSEPLLARQFLSGLDNENKKFVFSCFRTSSLRDAFSRILEIDSDVKDEDLFKGRSEIEKEHIKKETLKTINQEFDQFQNLMRVQVKQRFGFMTLLRPAEVYRMLENKDPTTVINVLRYLPHSTSREILRRCELERRREIFKALNEVEQFSADHDQIQLIENELKGQLPSISAEILMPNSDQRSLMDLIVENERDSRELLEGIIEKEDPIFERYRDHLITFEDLIRKKPNELKRCLDLVENEEVAYAVATLGKEDAQRVLKSLPEIRQKMVRSLFLSHNGGRTKERIENARQKIMSIYRKKVKNNQVSGVA